MDWLFILEKVVSWAIPVICAAVVAKAAIPWNKAKTAQERGQELIDQEHWDSCSTKLVERIEALEQTHSHDKTDVYEAVRQLQSHDTVVDGKLQEILDVLKANAVASEGSLKAMDAKNTAAFIQIYQRDLIVDGKTYIENKCITPQQLSNYEKRYRQYKDWGGNGDVELWIKKIRELPVHYPTVHDFNEK